MIHLQDLDVRAGDFRLRVGELSLGSGEYLVILGPTGSGKTVLLETIAGLRKPAGGHIWFGQEEVTSHPPEKRRVGFVYQDYALFPHMTVERNIAFGVTPSAGRGNVQDLANLLGIDGLLHRHPAGLSGGEQQRVALARALVIDPHVLLLDEPLSALDRETRSELRAELKRIHKDLRTTVLHVTHDLDEAMALGDRLAVLVGGELRQVGPPAEVVGRPADEDVARLVGSTNILPALAQTHSDGRLRLTLSDGIQLLGAAGPGGPGGQPTASATPVTVVIRPEEIEIEKLGSTAESRMPTSMESNMLVGTVQDIIVHSVYASVNVEVPPRVVVRILRPDLERRGLEVGSRVSLRFPAAAVWIC